MFIDPGKFPFVATLETRWQEIQDEYTALQEKAFDPWLQHDMYEQGWKVYGLYTLGKPVKANCRHCPRTAEILESVPGLSLAGFSRLLPGTHITPHVGWAKSVYRLHLGLVVPDHCSLRVGAETRAWQEGKCLIFDDTIEHEAWNHSNSIRGTLMLDFLRPGISDFGDDDIPDDVRRYAEQLLENN